MTVRLAPSKATRLPSDDGLRPSPASMIPALTSCSLYLPMVSRSSVGGRIPASLSSVAFTITMTRIAISPPCERGHSASYSDDERTTATSTSRRLTITTEPAARKTCDFLSIEEWAAGDREWLKGSSLKVQATPQSSPQGGLVSSQDQRSRTICVAPLVVDG